MRPSLALSARLVVSCGDNDFLVNATHDLVVVDLPSLRAGVALLRLQPARGGREHLIAHLQRVMTIGDLKMHFRLAGRIVARLSPEARPGLLSRLLGLGSLALQPFQLFLCLWSRPNLDMQRHKSTAS
ncbi:MAG: hypothetical protein AB7G75_22440 [Candidatus Binatia bacterium]